MPPVLQPACPTNLAALASRHRDTVWRYLRVLGCDPALADDLTQDTFVVALRRQDFDTSDPVAALAFLRITARHLWLRSRHRRVGDREVAEADAVWLETNGDGDGTPRLLALRQCLAKLPPRSQELLASTYGDGASRSAAARQFGLGEEGIKSALRRLRASLHDCIARRLENQR